MATAKTYLNAAKSVFTKQIDFNGDSIKAALLTSAYTPNQTAHALYSDVSANEVTGTGYTAGGQVLASKTLTLDTTNKVLVLSAANTTWASSTITARYVVLYDSTSGALIGYVDLVSDQSSNNGNFVIQWDATGIVRLTVA